MHSCLVRVLGQNIMVVKADEEEADCIMVNRKQRESRRGHESDLPRTCPL